MLITGIQSEDFVNYKLPSLYISTGFCDWKCCSELGLERGACQNYILDSAPVMIVNDDKIFEMYKQNEITSAVVVGGLEPMIQIKELIALIGYFRAMGEMCDFVIYTGYYPGELTKQILELKKYKNIIVKFGRYIPDRPQIYDEVLGVHLVSDNQYALRIS